MLMTATLWALGGLFLGALCGGVAVYVLLGHRQSEGSGMSMDQRELIDALDDALAVVDGSETITLANEAFEQEFGTDVMGASVSEVFADMPALNEQLSQRSEGVVEVDTPEGPKHLDVGLFPVDDNGVALVLLHDVTIHEQHREKLEAQNERLDQFASFISHDLRNPLDVAIGRTNAIGRMNEDSELGPHIEKIQESLERMHQIITDVLALARHGEEIGEQSWTQLDSVATDAWGHVDTEAASLVIRNDLTMMADRDSLIHVFENLFRNAVEHVGSDVTVRTGRLDDEQGFFVADDGPGIPQEKREELLEVGATKSEGGTGLGLAIVSTIATAHGWEMEITDSQDGGARFEFSGVELAPGELTTAGQ